MYIKTYLLACLLLVCVELLIKSQNGYVDINSAIDQLNDTNYIDQRLICNWILMYGPDTLSTAQKDLLTQKGLNFDQLSIEFIQLCGIYEMNNIRSHFYELYDFADYSFSKKWAIILSLVRMGDYNAEKVFLDKIVKLPVDDYFVYELVPDIIYTKSQQAFNYLIKTIESQPKTCHSRNPENFIPINCAIPIAEQLLPELENTKFRKDVAGDILLPENTSILDYFNGR